MHPDLLDIPPADATPVTSDDLASAYLPLIAQQAQTIATLRARLGVLETSCRRLADTTRALRLRVQELEGPSVPNGAPNGPVGVP